MEVIQDLRGTVLTNPTGGQHSIFTYFTPALLFLILDSGIDTQVFDFIV